MGEVPDDQIALEYMTAVAAALDLVSLKHGERGDMGAALAALSACQAQLLAMIPDGRTRKFMRQDCDKKLQQYLVAAVAEDKRGVSKPSIACLPPKIH